jgi:hypothetical protein
MLLQQQKQHAAAAAEQGEGFVGQQHACGCSTPLHLLTAAARQQWQMAPALVSVWFRRRLFVMHWLQLMISNRRKRLLLLLPGVQAGGCL